MSFTVVIPTCNRPELLRRCLSRVGTKVDVVVTDDSRDDTTREMIRAEFPMMRWTAGPRRGPAANRNHGARGVSTEWIVFLDDDCLPEPRWLEGIEAAAADADVVEGKTVASGKTDSPFEEHVENLAGGQLWSCNLAIRLDVFAKLGGFDEAFTEPAGEDMELAWRINAAGLRVRFAADAVVVHPPRRIGWAGIWRRTWLIRWMPLYRLKTGVPTPGIVRAIGREMALLLRATVQVFVRWDAAAWRRSLFFVCWRWLTFPVVVPYILYWERRWVRLTSV